MRFFGKETYLVTVSIGPKKIIFCSVNIKTPFTIRALEEFEFSSPCISNLTIGNMTQIKKSLKSFFNTQKLLNAYTIFSLTASGLYERVISLNTEVPQVDHLQNNSAKKMIWDYLPLGFNQSNGKTNYYACGITREQLFQYQLLAITTNVNCISIVPQRIALITASKYVNPEHIATSSITNHASLQNYLNYSLQQAHNQSMLQQYHDIEKKIIFETLGLVLIGKKLYEQY